MAEDKQGFNKEEFVGKAEGKLTDKYEIIKEIGSGGFSRCLLVKNKINNLRNNQVKTKQQYGYIHSPMATYIHINMNMQNSSNMQTY